MDSLHPNARRLQQLRKLTEVSRALTYAATLEQVLDLTVKRATELFEAPRAALMLAGDDGALSIEASCGIDPERTAGFAAPLDEQLIERLRDVFGDDAGFLGVPLVLDGKVIGILAVGGVRAEGDTDEHEWMLSALADQAAVALERSRLNEMAEFRERLLGIVGHDLRNPLNAIYVAADLMVQDTGAPDKYSRLAGRVLQSSMRMRAMIDQLADFTRARLGGGVPLNRARTDLAELCRAVIDEVMLAHPGTELRVESPDSVVGTWDRDRLSQVLSNLVGNAVQHGKGAPIKLAVRADPHQVVVAVHNAGPPIPAELLPQLFDPFRRAATAPAGTHLGLGLYIAQQITEAHGGSITVTSNSDGTTFTLQLPRPRD